jgi:hypothetical protein
MVAAVDFNGQADRGKIKIDHPVAHRPFALVFAAQHAAAEMIEDTCQPGFGARRLQAAAIGCNVKRVERWGRAPLPA